MKKIILALAFSASLTGFAEAQTSRNPCYTTGAQTTQGIPNCISVGTSTPLPVVTTTTTGAPLDVEGNVASGTADSGNPVKVGGRYNATQPVPVDGQRLDFQMSPGGQLYVSNAMTQLTGVDGFSNAQIGYPVSSSSGAIGSRLIQNVGPSLFNGTTWDRFRSINGTLTAGTGTQAVAIAPTSAAAGGITPVVTSAAANNLVLKASAGNMYSVFASNQTATAGFLVILNATAAPGDGAITPLECAALPASGNAAISYLPGPPSVFSTGITAVVTSGANCFTKTTGVITAFISGKVQ